MIFLFAFNSFLLDLGFRAHDFISYRYYILTLQGEGLLQFNWAVTREVNLPSATRNLVSESAAPTVGDADLKGELKKTNKNLRQMIQ